MQDIGRRKEGGKFYTVYLVRKGDNATIRELRTMYKTVRVKKAGVGWKQQWTHYAVWCRGRK